MIDTKLSCKSKIIAAGWSLLERTENGSVNTIGIKVHASKYGQHFEVSAALLRAEIDNPHLDVIDEAQENLYRELYPHIVAADLI